MKKGILLLYTFLSSILFMGNVHAEEYKVDPSTGKYLVQSATCSYSYLQEGVFGGSTAYGFKITINNNKLSNIESIKGYSSLGKYNEFVYFNSLKYINFFDSNSRNFSCPERIYVNYLATPTGGAKQGYNLEVACDADMIGTQCKEAKYIENSAQRQYVIQEASEKPTTVKTKTLTCSYKKSSSNLVTSVANSLIYNKFSDGSQNFTTNNNETYNITSGSLNSCTDRIYIQASDNNNYSIVSACNENTNKKCVSYIKESLANTTDSKINDDGSSSNENASGVIDPDQVKELEPLKVSTNIPFDNATCDTLLGDTNNHNDPAYYLNFAFNLIKYAAIILFFVLTIVEYSKAVTSSNQDAIKKATTTTVKRLIIAVVIFLLPMLINFILRLLGIISVNGTCGIGVK